MNIPRSHTSLIRLALATLGLSVWASWNWLTPVEKPRPAPIARALREAPPPKVEVSVSPPLPPISHVLEPDRAKVAAAEEELDAVSRDRARAENRAVDADRALQSALAKSRAASTSVNTLAYKVRDPSTRIAQATSRGGFVKAERDKLVGEVAAIVAAPRPKPEALVSKSAVARPTRGKAPRPDRCRPRIHRHADHTRDD